MIIILIQPAGLNVLTIHAEVEGITCLGMLDQFIRDVRVRGASVVPLGDLLKDAKDIQHAAMVPQIISGRDGWVSHQKAALQEVRS